MPALRLQRALPTLLLALALAGLRPARAEEPPAPAAPPTPSARSAAPEIFPLAAVRPGMRGYGLTVKAGTKIERFEVEVLDVMRTFLLKQDVILVRCLGPEFEDHRVAQGMSGSPVYFEGKVAGALAYTWSWARHALGGVTPIETMLAEGTRPEEGRPQGALPPTPLRTPRTPKPVDRPAAGASTDLRPIGTPLCVSGFSPAARAALAEDLAPLGLTVAAGGGAGGAGPVGAPGAGAGWVDRTAVMEPGCALAVELMRGDFAAAAIGTCTYVDGSRVHGFGHEFQTLGETLLPMSVAYIYTVVASTEISFKLGGPLTPAGSVTQDRPSGITGYLDRPAPMVPFDVRMRNPVTKREESFHFEITPNTSLFQRLLIGAVQDCFTRAEATLGPNTKRYVITVDLEGLEPWSYEDVIAGFDGGFQRVLIGLVDRVMNHESQRARFESVKLDVEIEHTDRRAEIVSAVPSIEEARAGESLTVDVLLRPRELGAPLHVALAVKVPADAQPGDYTFAVLGGDFVPADVPAARDVADLPRLFAAYGKSTQLVAVMPTGRVDLDLDGRLLRRVPLSSLPRLVRSPGGMDGSLRPVTEQVRKDVPFVVSGQRTVTLRIRP